MFLICCLCLNIFNPVGGFAFEVNAVISDVPFHELPETGGEVCGGFVSEVVVGETDVGVGVRDVTVGGHSYDVLLSFRR